MHRNRSVDTHSFAMVPKADIPRSSFNIQTAHKTTFDAGLLVPVFVDEVLPGDTFNLKMTAFCRLATPLFPVMDNLYLDSFFFFVPFRLLWTNWVKLMGEQDSPGDSISFSVPQMVCPVGGYPVGGLHDHLGLPTAGQVGGAATFTHSALPIRAYRCICDRWFRDQNLQVADFTAASMGDGPDGNTAVLYRRGKRHDYFTSALPWPQKGGTPVSLPLGTTANIVASGTSVPFYNSPTNTRNATLQLTSGSNVPTWGNATVATTQPGSFGPAGQVVTWGTVDLTTATAATINQIRQAFQIQKLLERDARGGTRYTELIRAHFGVISPDARLQRPEYLGGGTTAISINPIAQTAEGATTPVGNLAAFGQAVAHGHGFNQSFTEHGIVLGIVSVRADLTYQQGLRRMWSRLTRYDFYFPVFAALGEQAILNKEIYCDGSATDAQVFGYQERWGEYRYHPSMITGLFRSTSAGTIDPWHLAQDFGTVPVLNNTFIQENPPVDRVLAVGAGANGQQFLFDGFFNIKAARPLPMYGVPGLLDHF